MKKIFVVAIIVLLLFSSSVSAETDSLYNKLSLSVSAQ